MAYNQCRLRHDKTLRVRPVATIRRPGVSPDETDESSDNVDAVVSWKVCFSVCDACVCMCGQL